MRTVIRVAIGSLFTLYACSGFSQQLKLGDNPSGIEKSAVLELVSTNQGLLLPRISDTSLINSMNPPNGMIIYYLTSNKLLVRTNGRWQEVVSANNLSVSNLADASISMPSNGQILKYNGSAWVNSTVSYLTSVDTSNITDFSQKVRGLFTGTAPININTSGNISIIQAGAGSDGYLSSTDWNTFNNKQAAGNYITDPGSNGMMARTALNTTASRTITGTTNKISISNGDGVSGNPTINTGSDIVDKTAATTYTAGAKQTFVNSSTISGLNLSPGADPSTPASGDFWNSTTTANSLKYRDAASTTRTLADLTLSQTLANKTLDNTNTITLKDANFMMQDDASTTKQAQFQLSSITAGQTRTITLPDVSTTMVGTDASQSLTNKTLTSSSNVLGGVTMTLGSDATGDIYYRNSSGILTRLPVGAAGEQLISFSGLPSWKSPSTYQATPADPTSTTNTTGRMMGLAGSITPVTSGKIMITISGDIDNNTASSGAQVQIRYGTGSAPANAAVLTGTTAGSLVKMVSSSATNRIPFHCNAVVTGLTLGTAYWIDLGLAAITSGTARIRDISISVIEL